MALESLLFALSASLSSNLQPPGSFDHQAGLGFDLGVSRNLGDTGFALAAGLGLEQGLRADSEASISRSDVTLRWKGVELPAAGSRFSSSLTVLLPFSGGRMGWESYYGGAKLSGTFSLPGEALSLRWLDLRFTASAAKHFHEYTTAVDGSSNSSASLATVLGAGADLGRGVSLSIQGSYAAGVTYGGNLRERWGLDQDLSLALDGRWSLSIGHSNSGSVLKANGRDLNIAIFDPATSIVYLGAGVNF